MPKGDFVVSCMTTCGLLLLVSYVKLYRLSFFSFANLANYSSLHNGKTQIRRNTTR